MKRPNIDASFIKEWEIRYYECGDSCVDDQNYQNVLKSVQSEIVSIISLSPNTLDAILKWKLGVYYYPPISKKIPWHKYGQVYDSRFKVIVSQSVREDQMPYILTLDEAKLYKVLCLPESPLINKIKDNPVGFGMPVASAVLHFIYPDKFPIIDVRTVETLYFGDKTSYYLDKNNIADYEKFRNVILSLAQISCFSLHSIDRALSAYHRDALNPEMINFIKKVNPNRNLQLSDPPRVRQYIIDNLKR